MNLCKPFAYLARLLCVWGLGVGAASAAYPEKPITIIIPFSAGGSTDALGRLIGEGMSARLKQAVLIDNKPGAGSLIGLELMAHSPADGYTLFLANSATSALPVMSKSIRIDPAKVTAPISLIATGEVGLIGTGTLPVKSWAEFVAYGKANPGKLSYGYAGGFLQLLGDYMVQRDKADAVPILYRGSSDAQQALLGGTLSMGLLSVVGLDGFIKDGRLKVLAVTGKKRMAMFPDVLTVAESGFPELEAENISYFGLGAPAGTPRAIIAQLNEVIVDIVKSPAFRKRVVEFGLEPASSTPEQLGDLISGSVRKWGEVARKTGFKPE